MQVRYMLVPSLNMQTAENKAPTDATEVGVPYYRDSIKYPLS